MELGILSLLNGKAKVNASLIRIGLSEYDGTTLFAQFDMEECGVCPHHSGELSIPGYNARAYRIYLDTTPATRAMVSNRAISSDLCSDHKFKKYHNGRIILHTEIDLFMHACSKGVVLHYKCGIPPHQSFNMWMGPARKRVNSYRR